MSACRAVVNIRGQHHACDVDHRRNPGLAHANEEAGAIWCSDGEARAAQRRERQQ